MCAMPEGGHENWAGGKSRLFLLNFSHAVWRDTPIAPAISSHVRPAALAAWTARSSIAPKYR